MKFLTTGEFAKLCGTQKSALFFYDKEGLLKPKYVSENGYRRYDAEQFFEYDMISILKETGSSLKEIKLHLRTRDPERLLILFEEKRRLLQKEKDKLARQQKMLEAIVGLTAATLRTGCDEITVTNLKSEALELMAVSPEDQATAEGCALLFAGFARQMEARGYPFPTPFGVMMNKEDALAKRYVAGHFFCRGSRLTPKSGRHTRPEGRYAVFQHSGDMSSHKKAYVRMLEELDKSGLTIAGNIYAYDMMSHFITGDAQKYMAQYCIQIQ